jgi:hypothetical protein
MTIEHAIGYGVRICNQRYRQLLRENQEDVRQELALCALTGGNVQAQLSAMAFRYGYRTLKAGFRGRTEPTFCREVLSCESAGVAPHIERLQKQFDYRYFPQYKRSCECGKCAKCRDRIRQLKRRNG